MRSLLALAAILAAAPALAEDQDPGGVLNPEELTLGSAVERALRGEIDMMTCASGYGLTKWGKHGQAREVFRACAEAGYTGAMTWMSQLDENGLGGPMDPKAAAEWDRRAAEAGDPVGQFNYGLDLMRGRGVPADPDEGRRMVDRAAEQGLKIAQRLQAADYDLDEVTPDADAHRYVPMM